MRFEIIENNFIEAKNLLEQFYSDRANLKKISEAGEIILNSLNSGCKIISCGNGGSMCDAMHFAEELTGRFRDNRKPIAALSISDSSHITCTANDYGYDEIFARYVDAIGRTGDVLVAISTSGNSENVVRAADIARKRGMGVIGLTGKDGGKLKSFCNVEIRVPYFGYADRIQEIHIKIIHSLIHYIELNLLTEKKS